MFSLGCLYHFEIERASWKVVTSMVVCRTLIVIACTNPVGASPGKYCLRGKSSVMPITPRQWTICQQKSQNFWLKNFNGKAYYAGNLLENMQILRHTPLFPFQSKWLENPCNIICHLLYVLHALLEKPIPLRVCHANPFFLVEMANALGPAELLWWNNPYPRQHSILTIFFPANGKWERARFCNKYLARPVVCLWSRPPPHLPPHRTVTDTHIKSA